MIWHKSLPCQQRTPRRPARFPFTPRLHHLHTGLGATEPHPNPLDPLLALERARPRPPCRWAERPRRRRRSESDRGRPCGRDGLKRRGQRGPRVGTPAHRPPRPARCSQCVHCPWRSADRGLVSRSGRAPRLAAAEGWTTGVQSLQSAHQAVHHARRVGQYAYSRLVESTSGNSAWQLGMVYEV